MCDPEPYITSIIQADGLEDWIEDDPEAQRFKEWRHAVQRGLLRAGRQPAPSEGPAPEEPDLPKIDQIFTSLENYTNMKVEYLEFSKIGKVMRRVSTDANIPGDDEFHFKERAGALFRRWLAMLESQKNQTNET